MGRKNFHIKTPTKLNYYFIFSQIKIQHGRRETISIHPKWPPTNQNQAHTHNTTLALALSFCPACWNTPTYPTNLCTPNNLAALL
jgi:hypothetical protein